MNPIFKYNPNASYSTKNLSDHTSTLNLEKQAIYLSDKGEHVGLEFKDIFKAHEIIPDRGLLKPGDQWKMVYELARQLKRRQPKLDEYFHMYRCQLNFAMFCATSALGISMQHLNSHNPLIKSVYRFHVYYHIRLILNQLGIPLPQEQRFNKVENPYFKSDYYTICREYGVDPNEVWMTGDWYYTASYGIFGGYETNHPYKKTSKAPPNNLARWIMPTSHGFTKKGLLKISQSVRGYVYLVLTSQVQARSSLIGNAASALDAQRIFINSFNNLVKSNYTIASDIARYQNVLEHARSKVDFSAGENIYMLPSDLNLRIRKTEGYNNKILISQSNFTLGINSDVNKVNKIHQSPHKVPTPQIKQQPQQQLPIHHQILAQHHEDEKVALTLLGIGLFFLVAYFFR